MANIGEIFEDFAGGLPVVGSIMRASKARDQIKEGKRLKDSLVRPVYRTPSEVFQATELAKNAFLDTRLPGQATAENKIQGNTSQGISLARGAGTNPNAIMAAITGLNENQNKAFTELADQGAEQQLKDQLNYQNALGMEADYRDKEFDINEYNPYMEDYQEAEDMIGAGNKNLDSAQSDLGSEATQIALAFATGGASMGLGGLGKSKTTPSEVIGGGGGLPATKNIQKGLRYTQPIYMRRF